MADRADQPWFFHANVERVIDGDTVVVTIDQGYCDKKIHQHLRLVGAGGRYFDAAEVRGAERPLGLQAKAMVADALPEGMPIYYRSYGKDKYGRWLSHIIDPIDVAAHVVAAGLGDWED